MRGERGDVSAGYFHPPSLVFRLSDSSPPNFNSALRASRERPSGVGLTSLFLTFVCLNVKRPAYVFSYFPYCEIVSLFQRKLPFDFK